MLVPIKLIRVSMYMGVNKALLDIGITEITPSPHAEYKCRLVGSYLQWEFNTMLSKVCFVQTRHLCFCWCA